MALAWRYWCAPARPWHVVPNMIGCEPSELAGACAPSFALRAARQIPVPKSSVPRWGSSPFVKAPQPIVRRKYMLARWASNGQGEALRGQISASGCRSGWRLVGRGGGAVGGPRVGSGPSLFPPPPDSLTPPENDQQLTTTAPSRRCEAHPREISCWTTSESLPWDIKDSHSIQNRAEDPVAPPPLGVHLSSGGTPLSTRTQNRTAVPNFSQRTSARTYEGCMSKTPF